MSRFGIPLLLYIPPKANNVKLILVGTPNAGIEAEILLGYYLVGRHAECQIRPKSSSVSDRHCLLQRGAGILRVFDLRSECGTFVNDVALEPHKWRVLRNADILRCGKIQFEVLIELEPIRQTQQEGPGESVSQATVEESRDNNDLEVAFNENDIIDFLGDDDGVDATSEAKVLTRTTEPEIDESAFDENPEDDGSFAEDGPVLPADDEANQSKANAKRKKGSPPKIPKRKKTKAARAPLFSGFSLGEPETLKHAGLIILALAMIGFFGYQIYRASSPGPVRTIQENY